MREKYPWLVCGGAYKVEKWRFSNGVLGKEAAITALIEGISKKRKNGFSLM